MGLCKHGHHSAFAEAYAKNTDLHGAIVVVADGTTDVGKSMVDGFLHEGAIVAYGGPDVDGYEFKSVKAKGTRLDLSDPEEVKRWTTRVTEEFGCIDVLVACVCSNPVQSPFGYWLTTCNKGMSKVHNLVQASIPYLHKSRRGPQIVLVSTDDPDSTARANEKFATSLSNFWERVSGDVEPLGIHVEIVHPKLNHISQKPTLHPHHHMQPFAVSPAATATQEKSSFNGDALRNSASARSTALGNLTSRLAHTKELAAANVIASKRLSPTMRS